MKLSFPSAAQFRGSAKSTSDYDFTRACFAVNVTASDIPQPVTSKCAIATGVFKGFVAPGGSISLNVPHGQARRLEIIAYQRTSSGDACPTNKDGLQNLDMSRLARVGLVSSFDTMTPEMTLDVGLQAPESGRTLISQYGLPSSCQPVPAPSGGSGKIVLGRAQQSGGNFKIVGAVSAQQNEVQLQGGSFKMRMSRRAQ